MFNKIFVYLTLIVLLMGICLVENTTKVEAYENTNFKEEMISKNQVKAPEIIFLPKIKYPKKAFKRKEEGTVWLQVMVNCKGKVEKVTVKTSSGSEILDKAAMKAYYKARFIPAKDEKGKAIISYILLPVTFRIR